MPAIKVIKFILWSSGLCIALLSLSCCELGHKQWPAIKEVNFRYHFAADREHEQMKEVIYRHNGKPLYYLDARFCWRDFKDERDYDFSGTPDCRLYPVDRGLSNYPTLLMNSINATADWQSYGRFTDEDVEELAGTGASRALVQQCRVRGMFIEIEIFDVVRDKKSGPITKIASLDMIFTAKNDPNASGDIAAEGVAVRKIVNRKGVSQWY